MLLCLFQLQLHLDIQQRNRGDGNQFEVRI